MSISVKTAGVPKGLPLVVKSIVERLDPNLFPKIRLLECEFHRPYGKWSCRHAHGYDRLSVERAVHKPPDRPLVTEQVAQDGRCLLSE
jgi:hypothetical protein